MHELGFVRQLIQSVQTIKMETKASKVRYVTLLVGEARGFDERWIQNYYDMLAEGTEIEGVSVQIETVPCTAKCLACSEIFRILPQNMHSQKCPVCSSEKLELCTGRELILKNIEVEFENTEEMEEV